MVVTLAVCTLRQQALDFVGNRDRVIASISEAKLRGATFRVGPELEITGYGCWDHYLESDTYLFAWLMLCDILRSGVTNNIICDIGMPVVHRNVRYNCRVVVLNGRILLIRPKMVMADSGNYHESRWFAMWPRERLEEHYLPRMVTAVTGQRTVPIGEAVISTLDSCIGFEICEELWVSNSPHVTMSLAGVEIFSNGSASHHELGKLEAKINMLRAAMNKAGGVYLYSNAVGCDGDRVYYDGASLVVDNGAVVALGGLFAMEDVVVTVAEVDLEQVRTFRGQRQSMGNQAPQYTIKYHRIPVDFALSNDAHCSSAVLRNLVIPSIPTLAEEIAKAPALWLFDYIDRCGAGGLILPLSGGIDSASVAIIVWNLAGLLAEYKNVLRVANFLHKKLGLPVDVSQRDICRRLLITCYLATANSSSKSKQLAEDLANVIGSNHLFLDIDPVFQLTRSLCAFGEKLKFRTEGGTAEADLALQNMQARLRLLLVYSIAQVHPTLKEISGECRDLLVLATANASESLTGYFTKYDDSSGDLNPIGSYGKDDLRLLITHTIKREDTPPELCSILTIILAATPTAELTPDGQQTDEGDLGMTYDQIEQLAHFRMEKRLGPYSMRSKLPAEPGRLLAVDVFHRRYATSRHKTATLPPTFHGTAISPDDNRFDMRPLIYPPGWSRLGIDLPLCTLEKLHVHDSSFSSSAFSSPNQ